MGEAQLAATHRSVPELLRLRYPSDAYALFFEVRNATGFKGDRAADAVVMSLYPSRGLEVMGFEFKASRSDWLRELKNPRKAEGVCRYCDRWWVVADEKGIVKPEELPKTWGLLVPSGDALRVASVAPLLEPVPLDRSFVGSLLREAQRASERPVESLREQIRNELWQADQEKRRRQAELAEERGNARARELEGAIASFERASGINIRHQWSHPSIGKAVSLILENGAHLSKNLTRAAEQLEHVAASARAAAAELPDLEAARG